MNTITWRTRALRQLRKIEAVAGKRIRLAVSEELADFSAAIEEVRKRDERTY